MIKITEEEYKYLKNYVDIDHLLKMDLETFLDALDDATCDNFDEDDIETETSLKIAQIHDDIMNRNS